MFWGLDLARYDCVWCGVGREKKRKRQNIWLGEKIGHNVRSLNFIPYSAWVGGQNATSRSISSLIAGYSMELHTALRGEGGNNQTVLLDAS